jgi:hypothetical protein
VAANAVAANAVAANAVAANAVAANAVAANAVACIDKSKDEREIGDERECTQYGQCNGSRIVHCRAVG